MYYRRRGECVWRAVLVGGVNCDFVFNAVRARIIGARARGIGTQCACCRAPCLRNPTPHTYIAVKWVAMRRKVRQQFCSARLLAKRKLTKIELAFKRVTLHLLW
jgi:hypothetical protein